MADDKFTDPRDESTPENRDDAHGDPGGAELADPHLPEPEAGSGVADDVPELSDSETIEDPEDTADDDYVDDPDTTDINEAKLERATDAVADDESVSAVVARKRNRANKPVRRVSPQESSPGERGSDEGGATTKTVARKSEATRKRKDAEHKQRTKPERTGPVKFINEAVGELRKVVWPTGNQVQQYFVVVLVFVLFIIAFVSLLDLAFGWVILRVFG